MGTTRGMANGSEVGTMWGADGRQRHVGTKVEPEAKWEPCGDHGEPSGWGGGAREGGWQLVFPLVPTWSQPNSRLTS